MADSSIGILAATSPSDYIDNETVMTGAGEVKRQRISAVQSGSWSVIASGTVAVTQSGSWTVAATQSGAWATGRTWALASGTDSVTAVISGTVPVSGTFWQATQPVSLASLPALATGANTIGAVNINGTVPVSGAFWQTTQPVSIAATVGVSGTFWQATQPVSLTSLPALAAGSAVIGHVIVDTAPTTAITAASLPLPSGAATSAKQPALGTAGSAASDVLTVQGISGGTPLPVSGSITATNPSVSTTAAAIPASATLIGVSDGTNLRAALGDSSGRQIVSVNGNVTTAGGFAEQSGLTAGALNADLVPSTDVSAYKTWSLLIGSSAYVGTLTWQGSNDNTIWVSIPAMQSAAVSGNVASTANATSVLYVGPVITRYIRVRMTAYTSGSASGVFELFAHPYTPWVQPSNNINSIQSGTWTVQQGNAPGTGQWLMTTSNTSGGPAVSKVLTTASTNATLIKASAGQVYTICLSNTTASFKYLHLHNLTVAPTVGTSVPVLTIGIPPNGVVTQDVTNGIPFATGISYSITGGVADTDATATAAGDVTGFITSK